MKKTSFLCHRTKFITRMERTSSNMDKRYRQTLHQSDQYQNRNRDNRACLQPGRKRHNQNNQNAYHKAQCHNQLEHVVAKRVL